MFRWSRVRILAPYTGWTFSHIFVLKISLKRPQINDKRGRGWTIFFKKTPKIASGKMTNLFFCRVCERTLKVRRIAMSI